MKEGRIERVVNALISLPFSAVVVRIPEKTPFEVETIERSINFRKAQVRGNRVEIPTGATVRVDTLREKIVIKDWRGRTGRTWGASIKTGEKKDNIGSENSQFITPNGVEIVYRRE